MNYIPFFLFIILSIINITTRVLEKNKIANFTKLSLAPLALIFILLNTSFDSRTRTLLIITYTFYLIGDAFLLSSQIKLFAIGLVSFLFGHICFTTIFILLGTSLSLIPFAVIILLYPLYKIFITTKTAGNLKIPMRIYSLILIVFISSSTMLKNPLLTIGTLIFTLSDSFIARNACLGRKKFGEFYIMGTYTLALILLSSGMILKFIS